MQARQANGSSRYQQAKCAEGECQADHASDTCDDKAFEQQPRNNVFAVGPQGGADCEFLPPSLDSHEREVHHVRGERWRGSKPAWHTAGKALPEHHLIPTE
jgi:hypothetical protein